MNKFFEALGIIVLLIAAGVLWVFVVFINGCAPVPLKSTEDHIGYLYGEVSALADTTYDLHDAGIIDDRDKASISSNLHSVKDNLDAAVLLLQEGKPGVDSRISISIQILDTVRQLIDARRHQNRLRYYPRPSYVDKYA